jgi:aspartate racemase
MLGVLGGMGPAATADFLLKFVALTPAHRDQEHLPVLAAIAPHIPDRSSAILGQGPSPMPALVRELDRLVAGGASAIAIPCNACHHWYEELQAVCPVPILHMATATVMTLDRDHGPVWILATRGTLHSGFYQRQLQATDHAWRIPDETEQQQVDRVIALVKAGATREAGSVLDALWQSWTGRAGQLILACTEIPIAAAVLPPPPFRLVDSTQELARYCVAHYLAKR